MGFGITNEDLQTYEGEMWKNLDYSAYFNTSDCAHRVYQKEHPMVYRPLIVDEMIKPDCYNTIELKIDRTMN